MNLTGRPVTPKQAPFVSAEWRKSARGQNCTLCLDGCQNDTNTTVLCHLRILNVAGMGQKPPDWFAVYGCLHCHTLLDRTTQWGFDDILRALFRTWLVHQEAGRIK